MKNKTVAVAMSGGVDSSMAAKLLLDQGYQVIGIHMYLGFDNHQAEEAAKKVAKSLDIKFRVEDISQEFKQEVIDYFVQSYQQGLTPNPCVKCNKMIKFGRLLQAAEDLGADYLATGHYLKKTRSRNSCINKAMRLLGLKHVWKLLRAKDDLKDQTYFLYNLTQEKLDKILFPIGGYKKPKIKRIANKLNLPYLQGESQDICFLSGDHNIFLRQYLQPNPGPIMTFAGQVLGQHQGLYFYTVGQRRGIQIGGTGPFYVAKCDYNTNTLYVVNDWQDPSLYSVGLVASEVNWLSGKSLNKDLKCQAVIRYGHKPVAVTIKLQASEDYLVIFENKQRAVTTGQSVVFYQGQELLGGGTILRALDKIDNKDKQL